MLYILLKKLYMDVLRISVHCTQKGDIHTKEQHSEDNSEQICTN